MRMCDLESALTCLSIAKFLTFPFVSWRQKIAPKLFSIRTSAHFLRVRSGIGCSARMPNAQQ
jgi:hypothetical protein